MHMCVQMKVQIYLQNCHVIVGSIVWLCEYFHKCASNCVQVCMPLWKSKWKSCVSVFVKVSTYFIRLVVGLHSGLCTKYRRCARQLHIISHLHLHLHSRLVSSLLHSYLENFRFFVHEYACSQCENTKSIYKLVSYSKLLTFFLHSSFTLWTIWCFPHIDCNMTITQSIKMSSAWLQIMFVHLVRGLVMWLVSSPSFIWLSYNLQNQVPSITKTIHTFILLNFVFECIH